MENLLNYRKKLKYLSYNRGTKELDLVFSKFADIYLDKMNLDGLKNYESLLNENERILQEWLFSGSTPPDSYKKILNQILISFKTFT